jgi:hypothetical protein
VRKIVAKVLIAASSLEDNDASAGVLDRRRLPQWAVGDVESLIVMSTLPVAMAWPKPYQNPAP